MGGALQLEAGAPCGGPQCSGTTQSEPGAVPVQAPGLIPQASSPANPASPALACEAARASVVVRQLGQRGGQAGRAQGQAAVAGCNMGSRRWSRTGRGLAAPAHVTACSST